MAKKGKKTIKHEDDRYVKLRPFDRWMFDFPYFKSLSKLDQRYILKYLRETVNGQIVKNPKRSILSNRNAQLLKLEQIKSDPQALLRFKKRKKDFEKKHKKKITELGFVKTEWQRLFNREVKPRREDFYSRMLYNEVKEIDHSQVNMKLMTSTEQELYHDKNANEIAEATYNKTSRHEDIALYLKCQQADRIDYYLYTKLKELIGENIRQYPFLRKCLNDLNEKSQEMETKKIKKSHYLFFLYTQLTLVKKFANTEESAIIINELDKIFKLVIYNKGEPNETGKTKKTTN